MRDLPPVPGIVLAAGASSRLGGGRAKQLLVFGGETLLRRAARAAVAAAGPGVLVIVVLGHRADEFAAEVADLAVRVVPAEYWASGMGASLKTGLRAVLDVAPAVPGIVVSLCDQPLVTAEHLRTLRHIPRAEGVRVVAAEYGDQTGVPAYFGRETFPELRALADAAGARAVLLQEETAGRLQRVPMPEAAVDVDTPEDAVRLQKVDCGRGSGFFPREPTG